jgi:hypothetical protein
MTAPRTGEAIGPRQYGFRHAGQAKAGGPVLLAD